VSLFVCDECGVVENTALAGPFGYWLRSVEPPADLVDANPAMQVLGDGKARCSQCNPEVAKWHRCFPREEWDGRRQVINR